MRDRRLTRGLTVEDLARLFREVASEPVRRSLPGLKDIERSIRGHESGDHAPGPRYRPLYARAFGTTETELFGDGNRALAPLCAGTPAVSVEGTGTTGDGDDMERRRLLQLAALGVGAGALGSSGEPVRQLLDRALARVSHDMEDWGVVCADHLHAIRTRPAAQAGDDLLLDLLAVRRRLDLPDAEDVTELQRATAALATLYANVLTRLGDHGSALRWWCTARRAADASGDLDLRLLVRGSEAGFGLYGQRDPETVLYLTERAERIAGSRPSVGLAKILSTRAKALSVLGRHDAAKQTLRILVDVLPDGAPNDLMPAYWTEDQYDFAESWVYSGVGDEARAGAARERVLARAGDYQYDANVRLHEALCTVVNGGVAGGMSQAATVVDALPASSQSAMITEMGKIILQAVPADDRRRPEVTEFRTLLTATVT
ncbi:hypothetical protein DPM19_13350 [Actinomadura craniellae]|uniref:XRE family transcriptional regulator n=1 Tax=Actinomadura craniellae TaxID=2231787 RepID=A0A365H6L4_9ACTN|nr:hypothetical protein DPM19_13350 [Actinomadura craniellae]